jgi:alkylmercury lyase
MTLAFDHEPEESLEARVQSGWMSIRAQFEILALPAQLGRLLARGRPVTVEQLATALDSSSAEVRAELVRLGAEWDERGQIHGLGLTLRPTRHKFTFDGATVYGWCASDVLAAPIVLGKAGVVESTCPATAQDIRIEITADSVHQVEPPGAVVSKVRPNCKVASLRRDICAIGLFFSSRDAAAEWLARTPEGQLESVADDFEVHKHIAERCGWAATMQ